MHAQEYANRSLAKRGATPLDEGDVLDAPSGAPPEARSQGTPAKKSRGVSAPHTEGGLSEVVPKPGPGSASSATGGPVQPLLAGVAPAHAPYPHPCTGVPVVAPAALPAARPPQPPVAQEGQGNLSPAPPAKHPEPSPAPMQVEEIDECMGGVEQTKAAASSGPGSASPVAVASSLADIAAKSEPPD